MNTGLIAALLLRRRRAPERSTAADNAANPTRQRLAEEKAHLEQLDAERRRRRDSRFGKVAEDRIIWFELIELELQDLDEQVNRISHPRK